MTHDWFSHMEEGHNAPEYMPVGCSTELVNNVETPLTPEQIKQLGCRPDDRVDRTYVLQDSPPGDIFQWGKDYLSRAPEDIQQQKYGVVGCFADLWIRRNFQTSREARSERSRQVAA